MFLKDETNPDPTVPNIAGFDEVEILMSFPVFIELMFPYPNIYAVPNLYLILKEV